MRSTFLISLSVSGALVFGACSSATEEEAAGKANSATTIASNSAASATEANSNTAVANGIVVSAPHTVDPNSAAVASADSVKPNLPESVNGKLEKLASSGGSADPAALAAQNARPAPDNSTFTSFLTDAGYEIRTFKSHPQLLKVEKRIGTNGSQTIKVYLRNGKIVNVASERIGSLGTASAATIVAAAGIVSAPGKTDAAATSSTGAKTPIN